jgi:hypothetical protein
MAKQASNPAAKSQTDGDLVAALVKLAKGYRDSVPVFKIQQPVPKDSIANAQRLLVLLWPQFGDCNPFTNVSNGLLTQMRLPSEGRMDIFHPSGAIAATTRPLSVRKPIGTDETKVDRKPLVAAATKVASVIAKSRIASNEEMRFESTWEWKATGETIARGKEPVNKLPTALFEVLVAFRRYLEGLPVLGRASVHLALGAGEIVTRWGIDWRPVKKEPMTHTSVLDPSEGAKRVMDDLFWRRPERPFTLKDFEPKSFELAYFSLSRRREQSIMQPAWITVLAPRAPMTMGRVVVVPAAPQSFEPMNRPPGRPLGELPIQS